MRPTRWDCLNRLHRIAMGRVAEADAQRPALLRRAAGAGLLLLGLSMSPGERDPEGPCDRAELVEDLTVLDADGPLPTVENVDPWPAISSIPVLWLSSTTPRSAHRLWIRSSTLATTWSEFPA